jgi:3-carboxy-cis,cis-muconate cycloisomerase
MKTLEYNVTPDTLFSREMLWQSWLDVEAALALTQGEIGMIPKWAADDICAAASLKNFDLAALEADIGQTMAPILSITRFLGRASGKAGDYVHWGATTQNVMQTGRILLIREADRRLRLDLARGFVRLADLASSHDTTLMAGRTNRQHALPITFGFKVAGWIEELSRATDRLDDARIFLFSLPFGGAVGAMHAFDTDGRKLNQQLAKVLGLSEMLVPGRSVNDIFIGYIVALSMLAMTVDRIMSELYLLMTEEIGEVTETLDAGAIGSSTMPQKVNPKYVVRVIAEAAELRGLAAPAMEAGRSSHEGDAASNHLLSAMLDRAIPLGWRMVTHMARALERIVPNPARMAQNAAISGGSMAAERLMMALAPHVGRALAHDIIHDALRHNVSTGATAADLLASAPEITAILSADDVRATLCVEQYCGDSAVIAQAAATRARARAKVLMPALDQL